MAELKALKNSPAARASPSYQFFNPAPSSPIARTEPDGRSSMCLVSTTPSAASQLEVSLKKCARSQASTSFEESWSVLRAAKPARAPERSPIKSEQRAALKRAQLRVGWRAADAPLPSSPKYCR